MRISVLAIWLACASVFSAMAADRKFTVVIDPGHGGHDSGAKGTFSYEKQINLNVALAFGKYIEKYSPEVRVIYTRKTDVFIPLIERANIANRNKADLFISIHTNALPKGRIAYGLETFTLGMHRVADNLDVAKRENSVILIEKNYKKKYAGFDPNSSESYIMFEFMQDKNMAQSVDLAKYVQKEVCRTANRPDKGVHQAGFLVLRQTSMPSCLIELGFITTKVEENLLNNPPDIDRIAKGIYQAFQRYRAKYDKKIVIPYQPISNNDIDITPNIIPTPPQREQAKVNKIQQTETPNNTNQDKPQLLLTRVIENRSQAEIQNQNNTNNNETIAATNTAENQPPANTTSNENQAQDLPVFKLQIIASETELPTNHPQFKGEKNVDKYKEGAFTKYTIGASTDYQDIQKLKKDLSTKFPGAFIIAFKNGQKYNINQAIQEYKIHKIRKTRE